MLGERPALKDWLKQLYPRLTLETFKLDTNTPESICLLDLEVKTVCFIYLFIYFSVLFLVHEVGRRLRLLHLGEYLNVKKLA